MKKFAFLLMMLAGVARADTAFVVNSYQFEAAPPPAGALILVGSGGNSAASGTAVSVTHGLTISSGDLVLAIVHANGVSTGVTDNNGGYAFTEEVESGGTSFTRAVYWRIAGSSEPASYAWTLATSQRWAAIVFVFSPQSGTSIAADPFDVAPLTVTDSGGVDIGTATAPGISAGVSSAMIIAVGYVDSSNVTFSSFPGDGFSEVGTVNANQPVSVYAKTVTGTPPIVQGDVTWTLSGTTLTGGEQFSLKPGE
jgi:hypothetical protein